jgi:hypothetical protein
MSLVIDENGKPHVAQINDSRTADHICKGDWNDVRVVARVNNFWFFGLASEVTENLPLENRLDKGLIALQVHDPGRVVRFRDIRINALTAADSVSDK